MDYQELKQLEDDLWEAADQLRANSKLTASEYSSEDIDARAEVVYQYVQGQMHSVHVH